MQISPFKTEADFQNAAPPPMGHYLRFIGRNPDGSATEYIKDHTGAVKVLNAGGGGGAGGGIPEAPADGKTYGRKDAAWAEITATGGGGDGGVPAIAVADSETDENTGLAHVQIRRVKFTGNGVEFDGQEETAIVSWPEPAGE